MMPNRSPFIITPLPPIGERQALRSRLDTTVTAILRADGQELAEPLRSGLIDRLTEATMLAGKGLDLSSTAALDQSTLVATGMEITADQRTEQQWNTLERQLTRVTRKIVAMYRTAPQRPIQERRAGAGRPLDVWKGALLNDVERALRDAGVRRCYWTTEQEAATVLSEVFRACAAAAGQPVLGDLRNIQRRRFRPHVLLPFSVSRLSIRRLARAIWQFLPLKG